MTVMVSFMCEPDWAMRCPDRWLNIIAHVSVKVLPGEVSIWVNGLSKALALPSVGGPHSIHWVLNRTKGRVRKTSLSLSDYLRAGTSVSSCLRTHAGTYIIGSPASQNFNLDWNYATDASELPAYGSWNFSVSVWTRDLIIHTDRHTHASYWFGSVSLENPNYYNKSNVQKSIQHKQDQVKTSFQTLWFSIQSQGTRFC